MTSEASKTRAARGEEFAKRYLQGRIIDIGCGADLIAPNAEPFDLAEGDAQRIAEVREPGAYDAVCSSHCLEHMRDVRHALAQWWTLVRPGGYLILVVPDEDLYEQGGWPSLFNSDHKATFRLGKATSWSPNSYDILALVRELDGSEIISCERQDQGYDYSIRKTRITRLQALLFRLEKYRRSFLRRTGLLGGAIDKHSDRIMKALGTPVDQTLGAALAQIQVIARKSAR